MKKLLLPSVLILCLAAGLSAQTGPYAAQIQGALRSFLTLAHTWTATQTFGDITVGGTCTGCGGGGTPGGSDTQVQFNNASSFGGDADFTFTPATNTLATGKLAVANVSTSGAVPFIGSTGLLIDVDPDPTVDTHISILGEGINPPNYKSGLNVGVNSAALNLRLYLTDAPGYELQFTPYEFGAIQVMVPDSHDNYLRFTVGDSVDADKGTGFAIHKFDVADSSGWMEFAGLDIGLSNDSATWPKDAYITGSLTASALKTDTTTATLLCQVYDVDGAAYSTFCTATNGNTPSWNWSAPAGGSLTGNFTTLQVGSVSLAPSLSGTTGSIGGGALLAGACTSGTVAVTSSTTSMTVTVSPNTYPGDGTDFYGYVSSNGTVTVKVCALVAVTPTTSTYNVRVVQ